MFLVFFSCIKFHNTLQNSKFTYPTYHKFLNHPLHNPDLRLLVHQIYLCDDLSKKQNLCFAVLDFDMLQFVLTLHVCFPKSRL